MQTATHNPLAASDSAGSPQPSGSSALLDWAELGRVGLAVTMLLVLGTLIIIVQSALSGYNSLLQCGPKAILDGAVIAMLIGRRRRWRPLALVGPVYGLVLLLQTGIVYLPVILTIASVTGAGVGWTIARAHVPRVGAVIGAAVVFELLAGAGRPLHIYFGTGGGDEPLLWFFYMLEWPVRIIGTALGVWIGWRYRATGGAAAPAGARASAVRSEPRARRRSPFAPATTLVLAMVGCVVPMGIDGWLWLGALAGAYLAIAWIAAPRRSLLAAVAGLVWVSVVYAAASYAWHQDAGRVIDLGRTVLLRFMPLTCSAVMIVTTLRPVALVRVLRRWRLSPVVLLPLASSLRALPAARRRLTEDVGALRASDRWRGPLTPVLRPIMVIRALFVPQFNHWADQLAEARPRESSSPSSSPDKDPTP